MKVLDIKEHEDGSATYKFDLTPEENEAMCKNGIMWAIVASISGITIQDVINQYNDSHNTEDE